MSKPNNDNGFTFSFTIDKNDLKKQLFGDDAAPPECGHCCCEEMEPPTIHEAAAAFRKEFGNEPWFVCLQLPRSELYITAVVDASYFPIAKKVKLAEWWGFPLAVARIPGLVAEQERRACAHLDQRRAA